MAQGCIVLNQAEFDCQAQSVCGMLLFMPVLHKCLKLQTRQCSVQESKQQATICQHVELSP